MLSFLNFWLTGIIFVLLLVFLVANRKKLLTAVLGSGENRWSWKSVLSNEYVLLFFLFLTGFMLRMFFVPHSHYVFDDEFFHLDIAKNMAADRRYYLALSDVFSDPPLQPLPQWMPLFHFLLSLFFWVAGASSANMFLFNVVVGTCTIPLFFAVGKVLFRNNRAATIVAGILCFSPLHLKFSGGGNLEPLSLWCISLFVLVALLYYRKPDTLLGLLLLVVSVLVFYARIENAILSVVGLLLIVNSVRLGTTRRWFLVPVAACILLLLIQVSVSFGSYRYWRSAAEGIPLAGMFRFLFRNPLNQTPIFLLSLVGIFVLIRSNRPIGIAIFACWLLYLVTYVVIHRLDLNHMDFNRYSINTLLFLTLAAAAFVEFLYGLKSKWGTALFAAALLSVVFYPFLFRADIAAQYRPGFAEEVDWIKKTVVSLDPEAVICSEEAVLIRSVTGRKTTIPEPLRDRGIPDGITVIYYRPICSKRRLHTDWLSFFQAHLSVVPLVTASMNTESSCEDGIVGFYLLKTRTTDEIRETCCGG